MGPLQQTAEQDNPVLLYGCPAAAAAVQGRESLQDTVCEGA